MGNRGRAKVMAILALCVSVVGLTLGFAAFSNTLTISSSATVSPDSSDFKLMLYGIPNHFTSAGIDMDSEEFRDVDVYTSTSKAGALIRGETSDVEYAVIDNENLTLKNIKATFKGPGDGVSYFFVLKNEGKYDAYIDISEFSMPGHTCEAAEGTTQSLVDEACQYMTFRTMLGYFDNTTGKIDWDTTKYFDENGNVEIPVNSYVYLNIRIYNATDANSVRADGDFTVDWDDVEIKFSTVSQ